MVFQLPTSYFSTSSLLQAAFQLLCQLGMPGRQCPEALNFLLPPAQCAEFTTQLGEARALHAEVQESSLEGPLLNAPGRMAVGVGIHRMWKNKNT